MQRDLTLGGVGLLTLTLAIGCSGSPSIGPDAGPAEECGYGASIFDESFVHEIDLTFSDADWNELIEIGTEACEYCDDPRPYFPAAMVVDGEPLPHDVGVRLKGHYSLMLADWENHIFPFKVDFNRYAPDQTFEGLKKLNLHQDRDGSSIVEYISYRAVREHLRGGTTPTPASRSSFTTVTVNGEDLGLYGAVEQVGGAFLACHFPEPRGHLYKPEEASEHLSLPFTSYDDYPVLNFKWGPEELEDPMPPVDHSAVGNMINESQKGLFALEAVVDTDGVLLYHAANIALGNHDYYGSYGHNYYLYEVTPGVFTLIVWDLNEALATFDGPCGADNDGKPLNEHLLQDPAYVDRYEEILEEFMVAAIPSVDAATDHAISLVVDPEDEPELLEAKEEILWLMEWLLDEVGGGIDICD